MPASWHGRRTRRGARFKGVMFTRFFFVLFFVACSNAAYCCDLTEEYIEELVEHTRSTLDEYSACVSSVSNYERWIELSACKNQSDIENCEEHVEKEMNRRLNLRNGRVENSEHCEVFLSDKEEFKAYIKDKGVQKCKT